MEISLSSNSITDAHIATKFGTCHDSPAVVPCAKYCSDHFISIWMGAKWNFHHIWIVMEKLLVKWAPGPQTAIHIELHVGLWDGQISNRRHIMHIREWQFFHFEYTFTEHAPVGDTTFVLVLVVDERILMTPYGVKRFGLPGLLAAIW